MLDKEEFYHGAALVRLLENSKCESLKKSRHGYVVNDRVFIFIKYTSHARSPWRFTFDDDDMKNFKSELTNTEYAFIALVCGGDGVCVLPYNIVEELVGYENGSIGVWRRFNQQYGITGTKINLTNKIPRANWPNSLFN